MSSGSASESCCDEWLCGCESWLTAFCDYESVTLIGCDGQEYSFTRARSAQVPQQIVNEQSGVFAQDRIFRLSMLEHEEAGQALPGSVIRDSSGQEWKVMFSRRMESFCLQVMTARSVAYCFGLNDRVEILERQVCDDCEQGVQYVTVARPQARMTATGASRGTNGFVYRFTLELASWPLKELPTDDHRVLWSDRTFRITEVQDRGDFAPFVLRLERDDSVCSDRGLPGTVS